KVEKYISDFIKHYAKYPESYEKIAFDSYAISLKDPEDEETSDDELIAMENAMFNRGNSIEIRHEYKLTDISGETVTAIHYFLIIENDGAFSLNTISDHD